jgi:5-hydroxyisourate hydrolase
MSAITTHILDISRGRPASNVEVFLALREEEHGWQVSQWKIIGQGATDADGRVKELLAPDHTLTAGTYRLTFMTGDYFASLNIESFYPEVSVTFKILDTSQHYHVPLLLSPYGYSTYRGS